MIILKDYYSTQFKMKRMHLWLKPRNVTASISMRYLNIIPRNWPVKENKNNLKLEAVKVVVDLVASMAYS